MLWPASSQKKTGRGGVEFAGPENDGSNVIAGKWKTKSFACIHAFSSNVI